MCLVTASLVIGLVQKMLHNMVAKYIVGISAINYT